MDVNDEASCKEVFEEAIDDDVHIDSKLEQCDGNEDEGTAEYLDLGLEVDTIPDVVEYYPTPPKPRRGRRKKSEIKSQSQTSLLKSNYSNNAELKLGPKYRPIRPKPYQPNTANRNKMFGVPSTLNISALGPSNRFIVTTPLPCKEKNKDTTVLNSSNTKTNYVRPLNGDVNTSVLLTKGNNEKNSTGNSAYSINRKELRIAKPQVRNKGSIELFFESMAQTVLNLPMHVQAEIKMEICKLVTMAEIKYSAQSKQNHKNG